MICVSSKYSVFRLSKIFGCLNTHLGDLCVHFGDEWAFGQMSRKTWLERVKAAFFGPTVAISSFVAEKRSEVRDNHRWVALCQHTESTVARHPPWIIDTIFGTLSRGRAKRRGQGSNSDTNAFCPRKSWHKSYALSSTTSMIRKHHVDRLSINNITPQHYWMQ